MTPEQRQQLEKLAAQLALMGLDEAQWIFKEEKIRRIRTGDYRSTFDETTGLYSHDAEVAYGKE